MSAGGDWQEGELFSLGLLVSRTPFHLPVVSLSSASEIADTILKSHQRKALHSIYFNVPFRSYGMYFLYRMSLNIGYEVQIPHGLCKQSGTYVFPIPGYPGQLPTHTSTVIQLWSPDAAIPLLIKPVLETSLSRFGSILFPI